MIFAPEKKNSQRQRQRTLSNPTFNSMDRLIYVGKQFTEGYIGKKIFADRKTDNVILSSPGSTKILRKDKLDIGDIEGAKPSLRVQAIENTGKHKNKLEEQIIDKKHKTEGQDSLDSLLKYKFRTEEQKQQTLTKRLFAIDCEVSKNLAGKNYEFTKRNLGLTPYSPESPIANHKIVRSPTYISSFHTFS